LAEPVDAAPAHPKHGKVVRWGIAGPGRIANSVAKDFRCVDGAELVAVGSRSAERATDFARRHEIPRAHGSYAELLADDDVDVVYIATPHPQHHALALAAIAAGKAVLIEKTFTATVRGAEQVVAAARASGIFAMEAMWTRFQPAMRRVRTWLDEDAIGAVVTVEADLGVVPEFNPRDRLFAPDLGGGALLDLGVYVVSLAQWVLGEPQTVVATGRLGRSGVEEDAALLLGYPDGASALLTTSLHSPMPGFARIFGREGWIDILPRFHHPTEVVLHRPGASPEHVVAPPDGGGYSHELAEVSGGIRAGRTESSIMPLDDTLAVQRILEEAGRQLGVQWREDPAVV
jgi:predicted dehydrogenase